VFVAVPGEHVRWPRLRGLRPSRWGPQPWSWSGRSPGLPGPQIVVDRSQAALAVAAAWWYGDPSREMGVVGITGTDGKTHDLVPGHGRAGGGRDLHRLADQPPSSKGRRGFGAANPEHVTTPEAPNLQANAAAMVDAGNRAAVVETTSHGLALDRVGGVVYDVAIFTNLTHEHLELHGTFEAYRDAKLSLFRRLRGDQVPRKSLARRWPAAAIVNHDDPSASLFEATAVSTGARTHEVRPVARG